MEKINKHNYEAFFLDFIEGNLDSSYLDEFEKFLNENPSLKLELDAFENVTLEPETIEYTNKEQLIKETQSKLFDISNFEYLCAAGLENDLNDEEKRELESKLAKHSKFSKEYNLFKKTKLTADTNISYPYKNQLKRAYIPFYVKAGTSIAAAVVAIAFLLNQTGLNSNNSINSGINSGIALNTITVKPIEKLENNNNSIAKQEAFSTHNQTNKQTDKQTNKNDLAFNEDIESHDNNNLYEENTVLIPDIRSETLISHNENEELQNNNNIYQPQRSNKIKKEDLWKYAERGVSVFKLISSSEFEMKNKYKENGSIDKINLIASNFKFSKTFNKK